MIGIIPNGSSVETLLNNLKEADFSLKDVSVIMRDPQTRNAVAKDAGPFKGVTPEQLSARLVKAGLSQQEAQAYADAVSHDKVLIAIKTAPGADQPALEMLNDYTPERVTTLPPALATTRSKPLPTQTPKRG